jgi:hypothetical protein
MICNGFGRRCNASCSKQDNKFSQELHR